MTTTHTPGPWHYETSDDGARLWVDDGAPVIATDTGKWVQAWVFVEN